MSKTFSLSMIMAVAAFGLTAPLSAQSRSAVSVAEMDAAMADRPAAVRNAVEEFLTTDRALEVADRVGLSVADLSARVATLDQATLNEIAEQAGIDEQVLAGGADTIVITASTAIIILLLIVLLVR